MSVFEAEYEQHKVLKKLKILEFFCADINHLY